MTSRFRPRGRDLQAFQETWVNLCMKCSLGISNFLEEISSLSHSVVFLYFFALIAEEGFLEYSMELLIWMQPSLLGL